jgi:hypothetical protein
MSAELNPVEAWKAEKHGFDVWPDFLQWAEASASYDKLPRMICSG